MNDIYMEQLPEQYDEVRRHLRDRQYHWLITGVAGFIGSNLLEALLRLEQRVTGIDNFSNGFRHNLDEVCSLVGPKAWCNFHFIEGDIRDFATCEQACNQIDFVLHQAALGSVQRSIEDPILANASNVTGFLNMLVAARDTKVKRFVYAASSATYGDHPALPKVESVIGNPLSPYAVTKYVNELYAAVFHRRYGMETIGLRYFNVFGPRQNPNGAYASVIPKWMSALINGEPVCINGDGETSRDFCFVENVIQVNLLAALNQDPKAVNQVYNVALSGRTTLNQLYETMRTLLADYYPHVRQQNVRYGDFLEGDVRHSQADISKARNLLGFEPTHDIHAGLKYLVTKHRSSQPVPAALDGL